MYAQKSTENCLLRRHLQKHDLWPPPLHCTHAIYFYFPFPFSLTRRTCKPRKEREREIQKGGERDLPGSAAIEKGQRAQKVILVSVEREPPLPPAHQEKKISYNKTRILKKKENHRKWLPWPVCWRRPRRPRCCPRPARRGGCGSNTTGIFFFAFLKKETRTDFAQRPAADMRRRGSHGPTPDNIIETRFLRWSIISISCLLLTTILNFGEMMASNSSPLL